MMEWHLNDKIMSEWAWNELFGTKGYYYPRPPPFVPTVCQKLRIFNGMGGLGLLLPWSLTKSGLWPHTPNVYMPYFHTHNMYIWMTIYCQNEHWMMEWQLNDGMTFKPWNDIWLVEWYLNDRMTFELWYIARMGCEWVILAQRDTITLDPPFVPTVCQIFKIFNSMGGPISFRKKLSFGTLALCVSNQSVSIQASKYWCDIINPCLVYSQARRALGAEGHTWSPCIQLRVLTRSVSTRVYIYRCVIINPWLVSPQARRALGAEGHTRTACIDPKWPIPWS